MALSYNPGVVSTAGESLGRGLQNLGLLLGDAIQKREEAHTQAKLAGQAADSWRKSLGDDAAKVTNISDAEWSTYGSAQKAAVASGAMKAQGVKEYLQQQAQQKAQQDAWSNIFGPGNATTGGTPAPPAAPAAGTDVLSKIGVVPGSILAGTGTTNNASTGGTPAPPAGDTVSTLMEGIKRNPAVLQTSEGQSLLMSLISKQAASNLGPAPEGYVYAPDGKGGFTVKPDRTWQQPIKETKLDDGTTVITAGGRTRFVVPVKDKTPTEAAGIIQKSISAVTSQLNSPQTAVTDKPLLQKKLDDLNEQLEEQLARVKAGSAGGAAAGAVDTSDPLGLRKK